MNWRMLEEGASEKKDIKVLYLIPVTLLMLDTRFHSCGRILLCDQSSAPLCNSVHGYTMIIAKDFSTSALSLVTLQ